VEASVGASVRRCPAGRGKVVEVARRAGLAVRAPAAPAGRGVWPSDRPPLTNEQLAELTEEAEAELTEDEEE
jgi:hypothetical protein